MGGGGERVSNSGLSPRWGLYKGRTLESRRGAGLPPEDRVTLAALFTTFVERVEFRSLGATEAPWATAGGARDASELVVAGASPPIGTCAVAVPGNRLSLTELLFRPTSATSRRTATATSVLGFFIFVSLCGEQRVPLFSRALWHGGRLTSCPAFRLCPASGHPSRPASPNCRLGSVQHTGPSDMQQPVPRITINSARNRRDLRIGLRFASCEYSERVERW